MSFDPKAAAYSLDNALACAKASQLAYDPALTTQKACDAFGRHGNARRQRDLLLPKLISGEINIPEATTIREAAE
ncbi:MAG: hypothetical protein ABR878_14895 [Roseiarcus sp.]|jgi:hypothetical protein